MSGVGKPSGLVKRKGSNAYYLRLRYPPDVARQLGRAEFVKSLRTGVYVEAIKRLSAARGEFDAEVLAARRPSTGVQRTSPILVRPDQFSSNLTGALAQELALEHFHSHLRELDCEQLPARSSAEWRECVSDVEAELATLYDEDNPNVTRYSRSPVGCC